MILIGYDFTRCPNQTNFYKFTFVKVKQLGPMERLLWGMPSTWRRKWAKPSRSWSTLATATPPVTTTRPTGWPALGWRSSWEVSASSLEWSTTSTPLRGSTRPWQTGCSVSNFWRLKNMFWNSFQACVVFYCFW